MIAKKFCRLLRSGLKKLDLFPTTQFLKYNQQSEYTTATGGLVSLGLIIIILILFSNKGMETLNRTIINSSVSNMFDTEPPQIQVVTSPNGGFMFALGILGLNLNDPLVKYFDITLVQNFYTPIFQIINTTQVPLVQCTAAHFSFNDDVMEMYHRSNLPYAVCPPLDYSFSVGGRITSNIFSQFTINIQKCNATANPNCAPDPMMAVILSSIGEFTIGIPFVNTIINPNDHQYLLQYLQGRNYFTFTPSYGVSVNAQIAQHQIDTDVSIMPYQQTVTQYVNTIPDLFSSKGSPVNNDLYASITFSKSSSTNVYTRSFNKLDEYFSYIGGLIGSCLVIFFMLKSYSQSSFLIDIASLMLETDNSGFSLKDFNLIHYFGVLLKKGLDLIHLRINWEMGDFLIESIEEMEEQLDIRFLLQKIAFLEEAVTSILSQHQTDALYLRDKRTLDDLKKQRKKHQLAQVLSQANIEENSNYSLKNEDIISQSIEEGQQNQKDKLQLQRIRRNIQKVASQSQTNNLISERIFSRIDAGVFEKLGILSGTKRKQIELKEQSSGQMSSSNINKHHKNAVLNLYQPNQQKQKGRNSAPKGKNIIVDNLD